METYQLNRVRGDAGDTGGTGGTVGGGDRGGGEDIDEVRCPLRGPALLNHPMFNKGSSFSDAERDAFALRGLLPPHVANIDEQAARIYRSLREKPSPLEKYIGLSSLQDRNEILFYRLVLEHLEEFAPIVYTPTVGVACQQYSHHFRRPRGIWITPGDRGRIYDVLGNAPYADVRLIVVTDNERILGLGDQGAGGMGIPVGKLVLYAVAAGIHPTQTLPVSLDVGTDNGALRSDELYLGWRQPRLRGAEYDSLVDEFVHAVKRRWPGALLQWEDFKKQNAFDLLDRYRDVLPSFNDDIQGTAAVAVAGVLAAARASGIPLPRQRIVILGGGAAGIGIARQLRTALGAAGMEGEALIRAVAVLDSAGLLVDNRPLREASKRAFAWPAGVAAACGLSSDGHRGPDLLAVVRALRPTVLIGTTGEAGAFSEEIVRAMAAGCERPAILPFSNPTSNSEAIPADLFRWTGGRALVATGSPFAPVRLEECAGGAGGEASPGTGAGSERGRTVRVSQGNNVYVFPGVGLGTLLSGARRVSDEMFVAAAETLAACVRDEDLRAGALYPPLHDLRAVTARVAASVVRAARRCGVATRPMGGDDDRDDEKIAAAVAAAMWTPRYPRLIPSFAAGAEIDGAA
jgi:malic enzyme